MRTLPRLLLVILAVSVACSRSYAGVIAWNTWNSDDTSGSIVAGGTPVAVSFVTSNYHSVFTNYPSWGPYSTFADGVIVQNTPVPKNNIMGLVGGTTALNTLTFSVPVVNPVMSIWSLGAGFAQASFHFTNATPIFVAGGPSNEYGGSAITVIGPDVFGQEGNGTVEFVGTYNSLTWTNPQFEDFYGFNVGIAAAAVPEPSAILLSGFGVAGIGFSALRRRIASR